MPESKTSASIKSPPAKEENLWINLIFNLVLPVAILSLLSAENRLGPLWALVAAVSLPLSYLGYDLIQRKKWNFFAIVGFLSVMLTGGLGLLKVDGFWFAVKEAGVPLIFGIAVLLSLKTKRPLVKLFLYNEKVIDTAKVQEALERTGNVPGFNRLLRQGTAWLAGAFLLSAVLNFILARWILVSPGGTPEFNQELGRMTALSWPVITLPMMVVLVLALLQLLKGIKNLTGLELEEIFKNPPPKKDQETISK